MSRAATVVLTPQKVAVLLMAVVVVALWSPAPAAASFCASGVTYTSGMVDTAGVPCVDSGTDNGVFMTGFAGVEVVLGLLLTFFTGVWVLRRLVYTAAP